MYTVRWDIEVDATNPLEAARRARSFQQPGTTATVFDVRRQGRRGPWTRIDLNAAREGTALISRPRRRRAKRRRPAGRPSHAWRRRGGA